jgi:23S rRNA pseudouridine2604 synthase
MAIPPKPAAQALRSALPLQGQAEPVRLNKRMADLGLCSRRQADDWIARGWVRVDGRAAVLGQAVSVQARIEVDRQAHERQSQQVTVLINKPVGFVSGQAEDGYRPAVSLLQPLA